MNVVDSSAWLEYFAGTSSAHFFAAAIEDTENLVVPTICLYEVYKHTLRLRCETDALQAIALMQLGNVVELDASLALRAAHLGQQLNLPMADSIILATARAHEATLWTQDSDFKGLENVKFIPKKGKN